MAINHVDKQKGQSKVNFTYFKQNNASIYLLSHYNLAPKGRF